ncbi:MAG: glutamate--tRNA ligase [Opitutales bacterium]|nr:glutamate--tRNA ligase [Opitutales bacterium]MCH8541547.1 glutamate--tRNA ligase [Opitutales bacterium]
MSIRVRFAPSPTGFFHIGSARTALFNWLYARHHGGKFILRIEDTDRERNTDDALRVLLEGMRWLGLDWDEGPEAGGEYGPYFQSERNAIYDKHLQILRDKGLAYDHEGAVFFKVSGEPQVINDLVRGRVERKEEKDFVIYRSNGSPVFHFVNVVDDMTMGITDVIRGEDHLSNTSKHCELFKAFGVEPPRFGHIPLILKQQGPGKMSKRDAGSLIEEYDHRHFIPAAVRNYLALLGWSPKDNREILSAEELVSLFDLSGVTKNNAKFDERKLSFINAQYLHALPAAEYLELARSYLKKANWRDEETRSPDNKYLDEVLLLCQEKLHAVDSIPAFIDYFFVFDYQYAPKAVKKIMKKGDPVQRVREFVEAASQLEEWTEAALEKCITTLAEANGVGTGEYIHPCRLGVSGTNAGPGFYGLLVVLGKDRTLERLQRFVENPPVVVG